jgi:TolA-binding protein
MTTRLGVLGVGLAVLLAACAGPARTRVDMPEPTPAAAPPSKPQPASEPPRQADQLARIASELTELQNAMAKLMMSARQHDDQLLYLQRRLGDVENQMRGRGQAAPTLPPSAAVPAPLPPPPLAGPPLVTPPTTTPRGAAVPSAPAPSAAPRAPAAPPRTPPPSADAVSPADDLYREGLAKYQAGDLEGAVVTLYEVVANFPTDPAREHAQLLVGEIFFAQKDYRGAVAELEGLIAAVPGGAKVPDALLKIGMAQRSLGDDARARRTWERLVKDYPTSAPARQARTLLKARG